MNHLRLAVLLAVAAAVLRANAAPLLSPWDAHPVTPTEAPYTCPAVPHLPVNFVTDGFYALNDPTHSIIDPVRQKAYQQTSGPVKHEGDVVVAAADAFRTTGSEQAAACVLTHIETQARERALTGAMSSSQAYFVQGWVVGAEAIAYLKVDGAHRATSEQRAIILPWLKAIGGQTQSFYRQREQKSGSAAQNHFYWAAVQLAATGIAADDRKDFDWAMQIARDGISAIRSDGTLPEEMRRGKRALHYHLYAAAPLVMLAELGLPNGVDLYAFHDAALKRLVSVSIAGLINPTLFEQRTGLEQERPSTPTAEAIGWAQPYNRRFPDPIITRLLAECPHRSYPYLGGLPPE